MDSRNFDTFSYALSFFNNQIKGYHDISPLRLVCKDWYNTIDTNQLLKLWEQLIRPEYKDLFLESKLSAKVFYEKNINARIDTYYVIGSLVPKEQKFLKPIPEPADNESLFAAFPKDEMIKIFYSREQAMKCVEKLSQFHYQHYIPLFAIRVNPNELKKSTFERGIKLDTDKEQECFEIETSKVMNHYSVFYAYFRSEYSTVKGDESFSKTITIKNSHLKFAIAEEQEKQNCRIQ